VPIKPDKNDAHLTYPCTFLWRLAEFSLGRELLQTTDVEKIKTHILCPKTFSTEYLAVYDITWKNFVNPDIPQITI
jgi:hypothetical protein